MDITFKPPPDQRVDRPWPSTTFTDDAHVLIGRYAQDFTPDQAPPWLQPATISLPIEGGHNWNTVSRGAVKVSPRGNGVAVVNAQGWPEAAKAAAAGLPPVPVATAGTLRVVFPAGLNPSAPGPAVPYRLDLGYGATGSVTVPTDTGAYLVMRLAVATDESRVDLGEMRLSPTGATLAKADGPAPGAAASREGTRALHTRLGGDRWRWLLGAAAPAVLDDALERERARDAWLSGQKVTRVRFATPAYNHPATKLFSGLDWNDGGASTDAFRDAAQNIGMSWPNQARLKSQVLERLISDGYITVDDILDDDVVSKRFTAAFDRARQQAAAQVGGGVAPRNPRAGQPRP